METPEQCVKFIQSAISVVKFEYPLFNKCYFNNISLKFVDFRGETVHVNLIPVLTFTCLKSTIETLEKGVKYVQI